MDRRAWQATVHEVAESESIGSQRDTTEVTYHACITNKIIKKICGEKDNKRKDGKGLQNQISPHSTQPH